MASIRENVRSPASHPRLERRRIGREAEASPHLIPLLRGEAPASIGYDADRQDDLAPAKGIALGVVISAVFWLVLFLIV